MTKGRGNNIGNHDQIIHHAINALLSFLKTSDHHGLEPVRIARAGWALLFAGCNPNCSVFNKIEDYLIHTQKDDGGWTDPEETAWCASFLTRKRNEKSSSVQSAIDWIKSSRVENSGWGKHTRDQARIPTTSLVTEILPFAAMDTDYISIAQNWSKDLSDKVQLSYKAGFYLLAESGHKEADISLVEKTIAYLEQDRNRDGGFGPWKNHPMGSDPWSTGVVLWGLTKWIHIVDKNVIIKALDWLKKTQIPSGYWPYHYLDDGTSLALIGAVAAFQVLKDRSKHV